MIENKGDLVKLTDLDPEFLIDLKYASKDNFTGHKIYNSTECWVNKHTAQLLIKAKNTFKSKGFYVKVWDAYRPISAQKKFWEIMPDDDFVARPPNMEKIKKFRPTHMNGMCVDITLTDMDRNNLVMPSEFDDMTGKASLNYPGISPEAKKNAEYMKEVMESVGFLAYENEWWHFYDVSTEPVPFMDYQI